MRIPFFVFLAAVLCACPAAADDATAHDVACMAAASDLRASSDPKASAFAPTMLAYYLGRLEERGLTDEDIQLRVDRMAMGGKPVPDETTLACANVIKDRLTVLRAVQERNIAKIKAQTQQMMGGK